MLSSTEISEVGSKLLRRFFELQCPDLSEVEERLVNSCVEYIKQCVVEEEGIRVTQVGIGFRTQSSPPTSLTNDLYHCMADFVYIFLKLVRAPSHTHSLRLFHLM
jgi:hypothetical protein